MLEKETIKKIYDMMQEDLSEEIVNCDEYKKLRAKFNKVEVNLRKVIGIENYKKVEELLTIYALMSDLESERSFIKGFSISNMLRDESLIKD